MGFWMFVVYQSTRSTLCSSKKHPAAAGFTAGSQSVPKTWRVCVQALRWAAAETDLNPDASVMRLRCVDVPALRVCCSVIAVVCTNAVVFGWKSMSVFAETCCERPRSYVDDCSSAFSSPPIPSPPRPAPHSSISDHFSCLRSPPQAIPEVAVGFCPLTPLEINSAHAFVFKFDFFFAMVVAIQFGKCRY